ncbi:MAG TPA: hypothetical protein VLH56_18800 [Dissulfurispiraceae bacterium]|nr:hypothetical protein [Dissulfurispiraceae bacterium]
MKARFSMAPDAGSSGFVPEIEDDDALPFGERIVAPELDDVTYVVEGSPEAAALEQQVSTEPDEYKGKSREEILAELQAQRAALQAAQSSHEPVTALKDTLTQFLQAQQPKKEPQTRGYAVPPVAPPMDQAALEKRLNDTFMENPYRGLDEGFNVKVAPLLQVMAQNQAQISRELVLTNADTRKVYDRYGEEVEQIVAAMTLQDKLQNPRVYQAAVEQVKARHMDSFQAEALEQLLEQKKQEWMKELGVESGKPAQAVKPAPYAAPQTAARPAAAAKKVVQIPKWVEDKGNKIGVDPKQLYQIYRERGLVK